MSPVLNELMNQSMMIIIYIITHKIHEIITPLYQTSSIFTMCAVAIFASIPPWLIGHCEMWLKFWEYNFKHIHKSIFGACFLWNCSQVNGTQPYWCQMISQEQVMAWCHQATTNHYLSQCWPWSILPHRVTMPQRVTLSLHIPHKNHSDGYPQSPYISCAT